MKFQFVGADKVREKKTYQFAGERKVGPAKKLREDLADCMVFFAQEWNTNPVPLEEAKEVLITNINQAAEEGAKVEEIARMKQNIAGIEDMENLIKYIYNFKLRSSGLSVHRMMGGRK